MGHISLYDAKTHLSGLVDRAAAGEEIVIAKNGVPMAKLVPLRKVTEPRSPARALGITHIAPDFADPDPQIEALFTGAAPGRRGWSLMGLLLDTHLFFWWDAGADPIGPAVRAAIADPRNCVYVSAASVWEIAIKSMSVAQMWARS